MFTCIDSVYPNTCIFKNRSRSQVSTLGATVDGSTARHDIRFDEKRNPALEEAGLGNPEMDPDDP